MSNKLTILTHNVGGQTYIGKNGKKSYVCSERNKSYCTKKPISLKEDADIYCFQELICKGVENTQNLAIYDNINKCSPGFWILPSRKKFIRHQEYNIPIFKFNRNDEKLFDSYINIINFHGNILSETTTLNQWKRTLNIYENFKQNYQRYEKFIILGDFNVDFNDNNLCNIVLNSLKKSVKYPTINGRPDFNAEPNIPNFEIRKQSTFLYEKFLKYYIFIKENFILLPYEKIRTNSWNIEYNNTHINNRFCIDYCLISKKMINYLNRKTPCKVFPLNNYICEYWEQTKEGGGNPRYMENDFDHIPLKIELNFSEGYTIKQN